MDRLKPDYVARKYPYTLLMNTEFYRHKHSFWEFIVCINGKANHFVDEQRYPFSVGDVIIMKPDCTHDYKILENDAELYMHYDFYATTAEMRRACDSYDSKLFERLIDDKSPICFGVDGAVLDMLRFKLNQLSSIQLTQRFEELTKNIYSTILHLFCGMILENEAAERNRMPDRLTQLMAKMANPEVLCGSLSDAIAQSGYTHSHLCRIFKKHTGLTLIEYFTQLKIDYANVLLKNKNLNITEIALMLGYDSPSHFIQVYKKYNGTTPHQQRTALPQ